MSESIRVGIIGLVHDHIWDNLPALRDHSSAEIVAVADSNPELLTRFKEEYHCSATYEEYEDLLQEEELDAVYIYLSTLDVD